MDRYGGDAHVSTYFSLDHSVLPAITLISFSILLVDFTFNTAVVCYRHVMRMEKLSTQQQWDSGEKCECYNWCLYIGATQLLSVTYGVLSGKAS